MRAKAPRVIHRGDIGGVSSGVMGFLIFFRENQEVQKITCYSFNCNAINAICNEQNKIFETEIIDEIFALNSSEGTEIEEKKLLYIYRAVN